MTTSEGISNVNNLASNLSNESCRVDDTAVGNDGEEDIPVYHERTKSLTIMIKMSFTADDIGVDSGYRGVNDCGDL